jgi:hypothetical protein
VKKQRFTPPVPVTPSLILNRANAHHKRSGGAIFHFNRRELIALVKDIIAISQGAPLPTPAPLPWHHPSLHPEVYGQARQ